VTDGFHVVAVVGTKDVGYARSLGATDVIDYRTGVTGVTAADLNTLAGLYAEDGHLDSAITVYQAALAKDPEYFPARIALAQVLATDHRYSESIDLLLRVVDVLRRLLASIDTTGSDDVEADAVADHPKLDDAAAQ